MAALAEQRGCEDASAEKYLDIDDSVYCLTFTCMIKDIKHKFGFDAYLEDYFFKSTMVFFIQMLIISLILVAGLDDSDGLAFVEPSLTQMTLRLLCCYLFHLSNYKDVSDSFKRLKFLRYYPDKFEGAYLNPALVITMYQFTSSSTCELVNIIFLCRQATLIDLIMNYVAFGGISQLDNLYVEATGKMKAARILLDPGPEEKKAIE